MPTLKGGEGSIDFGTSVVQKASCKQAECSCFQEGVLLLEFNLSHPSTFFTAQTQVVQEPLTMSLLILYLVNKA